MSFIFVLIFSCTMFVGCGKEEKEEIPSMVTEPEKWEIEVRPGYVGDYEVGFDGLLILPEDPIVDRYVPEMEIEYVTPPISYANRAEFDRVLITYPYCQTVDINEWQYWPEFKCFYYNSKGERIESDYYATSFDCDRYVGDETEFEKIKNDTDLHSWDFAAIRPRSIKKDTLYRLSVEIYDSVDAYKKKYDIQFHLSEHFMGWFDTYIVVKGIEGEEK